MGPQPWELRKPAPPNRTYQLQAASMGPQPWELRKQMVRGHDDDFEAASMGPQPWELRKQQGGVLWAVGRALLQWGRSLGSCGNQCGQHLRVSDGTLQWGRSLGSCGNSPRVNCCSDEPSRVLLRAPYFSDSIELAQLNHDLRNTWRAST